MGGETMTFDVSGLDAMKVDDGGDEQPTTGLDGTGTTGDEQPTSGLDGTGTTGEVQPIQTVQPVQPLPGIDNNNGGTTTETDNNEEGATDPSSSIGRGSHLGRTYILHLIALL